ncbi:hypothetical protein RRSWK_00297 [Rhodopirellula sp. SWK7]|nr:hypothetical protein RRSWK_00297 [Rhodopirellula sp. SWK7]
MKTARIGENRCGRLFVFCNSTIPNHLLRIRLNPVAVEEQKNSTH